MTKTNVEIIRNELKEFVSYSHGKKLRKRLKLIASLEYESLHTNKEYMTFLNENPCTFTMNGYQNTSHPYYWKMFCVESQHVMGDCIEECLDKAMNGQRS